MKLTIIRDTFTDKSTIGKLFVNGIYECNTLEDKTRPKGEKIFGETSIPYGEFEVIIDYSPHFKKELPHILNVPMFSGVRIHSGNKDADTEGCILVGVTRAKDWIGQSHTAFTKLFDKLEKAYDKNEKITLEIKKSEG